MRKSAYELAVSWEAARSTSRGLPSGVQMLLDSTPEFKGASLLLGIPEHQVELTGGGHASQTDLWLLLGTESGVVSVAVEAKAGEPFDKPVPQWLSEGNERSGRPARLQQLCDVLGITHDQALRCRYQLLHRAVVPILEAKRFNLRRALFLVHSFEADPTGEPRSFADYACFADQLGATPHRNAISHVGPRNGIDLWIAWISSEPANDETVRRAV